MSAEITLRKFTSLMVETPGFAIPAIEEMTDADRSRLRAAAEETITEVDRAQSVVDELQSPPLAEWIEARVRTEAQRQSIAVEALLPSAAKHGWGVLVTDAPDGTWSVAYDPATPRWTVTHRRSQTSVRLDGEERNGHAG